MARFGLFAPMANTRPLQEYEGDLMIQDGEYVKILVTPKSENESGRQVAAIRLDKGQSVREIK